jgi:transposase
MVSRHTALRILLKIPLPSVAVPQVLETDDFALRRGLVYATVLIDAETGRRVDVVPGRTTDVAEAWLRDHPGIEVLCRDGSGAYGEAARRAVPQVSDRWDLWHPPGRRSGRGCAYASRRNRGREVCLPGGRRQLPRSIAFVKDPENPAEWS